MLRLENADIGYRAAEPLLSQVSLELEAGKVYGIVGLNGVGKSCFLRSLSGEVPLLAGILADGGAQRVAYVPPTMQVNELTTVHMMLKVGCTPFLPPWGTLREEDRQRIEEVSKMMGLSDWMDRYFEQLSSGQQQRVLIAMGLVRGAEVLCLDEPTAHLDVLARKEMFDLIAILAKEEGKVMVICTHSIEFALRYFDDAILLHHGEYLMAPPRGMVTSTLAQNAFGAELTSHWERILDSNS